MKKTFDIIICNPPFHDSPAAAAAGSARKQRNLGLSNEAPLNFAGQANELWCEGGEPAFLRQMLAESKDIANQVYWFTTLVSKQQHLAKLQQQLQEKSNNSFFSQLPTAVQIGIVAVPALLIMAYCFF